MRRQNRSNGRPAIWAEGRQHPPFDARAFARAALIFGRESMAALLHRCAASAGDFGAELATGRWRIPESRLGRTGRHLPDHRRVARAVIATGALLGRSAAVLDPAPPAGPAERSIFDTPAPAAAPPPLPAREPLILATPEVDADPSLAAIRSLIAADPAAPPRMARRQAVTAPQDPAQDPAPRPALNTAPGPRDGMTRAASYVLGYGLLLMSLPWGAFRATLAHLNGEDLRKLDA